MSHRWGESDNTKLNQLINEGIFDPEDQRWDAIKAILIHWAHKPYKNFAKLIQKKFKDICQAQNLGEA